MDLGIAEDNASRDTNEPQQQRAESKAQDEEDVSEHDIRMQQTRKSVKRMVADSKIALRNTDLAQWNNEYLLNMAVATKQKQSNKLPTLSKKNAAFWVFGQGIASVGIGLGASREPHPLRHFSGDDLYDLLNPTRPRGRKRCRPRSDSESELRRVRRKADGEEDQIGRGGLPDEAIMQDVRTTIHLSPYILAFTNDPCRNPNPKWAATPRPQSTMTIPPKCPGTLPPRSRAHGMDPRHSPSADSAALSFPRMDSPNLHPGVGFRKQCLPDPAAA